MHCLQQCQVEFEELIFRLTRELKELYDFEITIKSKIDPYFKKRINILELPPNATKIIIMRFGPTLYLFTISSALSILPTLSGLCASLFNVSIAFDAKSAS